MPLWPVMQARCAQLGRLIRFPTGFEVFQVAVRARMGSPVKAWWPPRGSQVAIFSVGQ